MITAVTIGGGQVNDGGYIFFTAHDTHGNPLGLNSQIPAFEPVAVAGTTSSTSTTTSSTTRSTTSTTSSDPIAMMIQAACSGLTSGFNCLPMLLTMISSYNSMMDPDLTASSSCSCP